jgi:hypothetical protein
LWSLKDDEFDIRNEIDIFLNSDKGENCFITSLISFSKHNLNQNEENANEMGEDHEFTTVI